MAGSKNVISEQQLDLSNDAWRATPLYQEAMKHLGVDPSKPIKLSEKQREALHLFVAERGMVLPQGTEFDPAGNVNRDDRGFAETKLGKALIIGGAIAATMVIPGVAPAVMNAIGLGGAPGAAGAAGSTAAPLASGTIAGLHTAVPLTGALTSAGVSTGLGTAAALGGAAKTGWDLLKDNASDLIGAVGRGFQSSANDDANNRGTKIDVATEQERIRQDALRDYHTSALSERTGFHNAEAVREQEGREGRGDAWKQLQQAVYVKNWAQPETKNFSPYSRQLTAPADSAREGAGGLERETMNRLMNGNPLAKVERVNIEKPAPFTVDPSLMEGSMWEKLKRYGGAGAELFANIAGGR